MSNDSQQQVLTYYQLLQKGVPARQAFAQAFPEGLPTRQQQAQIQAAGQQQSAYGQVGGVLAGALGTKAGIDAISGRPILGGIFQSTPATQAAAQTGTSAAASTGGTGSQLTSALGSGQAGSSAPAAAGASGAADVGAAGGNLGYSATTVPAGAAIPEGYSAVGTAADGGTMVAPTAEAGLQGGAASYGSYALPAVGIAAGGYGMYKLSTGRAPSDGGGAMQGAASGAAIGAGVGSIVPGIGTGIGAAVGAIAGGLYGYGTSVWGDKDKWQNEWKSLRGLQKDGTFIPQGLIDSMPTHGRSKEELMNQSVPADFVGYDPKGNWVNNKFAQSRNEADLQPMDIVNYSAFARQDPNWFHQPLEQRLATAKAYLDAGAVSEHHGEISLDSSKVAPPSPAPAPPPPSFSGRGTPAQRATVRQNGQFGNQLISALGANRQ